MIVRGGFQREAEMSAGNARRYLVGVAGEDVFERHYAASDFSGRYAFMKSRTFCSVSGHTRRPLSSWCTKGLSFNASSPKREALIS